MASIKDDKGYNQGFKRTKTFTIRIERRAQMMVNQMHELTTNSKILEIGCGTGEISNYIAKNTRANVTGIDICEPFINIAKEEFKHPNLDFLKKDFLEFNVMADNKYDYIIGNGILHHLYFNLEYSLESIHKMLKENGKIIFMEPNIYNPYCFLIFNYLRNWANLDPEEKAFSRNYIKKRLLKTNYNKIRIYYKDFLLPNTPFMIVPLVIFLSNILEKIFPVNRITQSIFIIAGK